MSPTEEPSQNQPSDAQVKNPGTVSDLHKKCLDLFPQHFEGVRIDYRRYLSHYFSINHLLWVCKTRKQSKYKFEASYFGGNSLVHRNDVSPVLCGEIDRLGNITTVVSLMPQDNIKFKLNTKFTGCKTTELHMTTDYKADRYTASIFLLNPDLLNITGLYTVQFLYAWSNKLSVGTEIIHHRNPFFPYENTTNINILGKYAFDDATIFSTNFSQLEWKCSYYFKASNQLKFGVNIDGSRFKNINTTFAFQAHIPKSTIILKGSLDGNGNLSSTVEKYFPLVPFAFTMSALFCPYKYQLKLGVGWVVTT